MRSLTFPTSAVAAAMRLTAWLWDGASSSLSPARLSRGADCPYSSTTTSRYHHARDTAALLRVLIPGRCRPDRRQDRRLRRLPCESDAGDSGRGAHADRNNGQGFDPPVLCRALDSIALPPAPRGVPREHHRRADLRICRPGALLPLFGRLKKRRTPADPILRRNAVDRPLLVLIERRDTRRQKR
jgi:hypothetical protein